MSLTPPAKSCYGEAAWKNVFKQDLACSDVDAKQQITATINHTLHVYYADGPDSKSAYPYYFIHRAAVQASAGSLFSDTLNIRGFLNSSLRISYPTLKVEAPDNTPIDVTCIQASPSSANETIETTLQGEAISVNADKGGGTDGEVVFEPTYRKVQQIPAWALEPASNGSFPAWELYQTKPWLGRGVTDAGGTDAKRELLDQVFNRSPFGDVVEMSPSSRGTVGCEFLTMWRVERDLPPKSRAVSLTLGFGYAQRLTLFHNARSKEKSAHRHTIDFKPDAAALPEKKFALHEIARRTQ